jgi:hypothetical protein
MKCCFKEMGLQKRIKMKFAWCVGAGVCAVTHIAKNYLASQIDAKVPLILGVWGGKGQGKSFQTELIFKALDIEPIIMSAGEMESEWAGEPGKLIRDRYRAAHLVIKNKVSLNLPSGISIYFPSLNEGKINDQYSVLAVVKGR